MRIPILALALTAAVISSSVAASTDFPTRPIRVIVPYGPGGVDYQMRTLGPTMGRLLGQPIVVENREGAGGIIGVKAAADAPADGYTLLYAGNQAFAILPYMRSVPYKLGDFVPLGNATATALAVTARADVSYKSFGEFIDFAKRNPGRINLGTAGAGTATHIIAEAIQAETGTKFTHVPYRGVGAAVVALLSGQVDLVVGFPAVMAPHVAAGKLRVLASTGGTRSEFMPDAPTLREAGLKVVEETKMGLYAPRGTPEAVVAKLHDAFGRAIAAPEFAEAMRKSQTTRLYLDARQQQQALAAEGEYWSNLFRTTDFLKQVNQ